MIAFELEISLGSDKQLVELSIHDSYVIGSGENCRIKLMGDRIKDKHAQLKIIENQWHVFPLEGEIRIAGELIKGQLIELGQPIAMGPYLMKVKLAESKDNYVLSDEVEDATKFQWKKLNLQSIKNFFKKNDTQSKTLELLKTKKKPALIAGAIFMLIAVLGLNTFVGNKEEDSASTIEVQQYDVETLREIQRYESWVAELVSKDDYTQAYAILSAAISKRPNVSEFLNQRNALIQQLIENAIATGDLDSTQIVLNSINLAEESNEVISAVEKFNDVVKLKQEHLANYEKNKITFNDGVIQAKSLLESNEPEKAQLVLKDLTKLVDFEPNWQAQLQEIDREIQASLDTIEQKRIEQQRQEALDKKVTLDLFNQCINYYKNGSFMKSHNFCVAANNKAAGTALSSEIQVWLDIIQPTVIAQMNKWNSQAEDCLRTNWIGCALGHWDLMLKNDPDNVELKQKIDNVISGQREIAGRLFNEARAYVDLGRESDAILILEELKKQLPIEEEEMYQKADEMIVRLELNNK